MDPFASSPIPPVDPFGQVPIDPFGGSVSQQQLQQVNSLQSPQPSQHHQPQQQFDPFKDHSFAPSVDYQQLQFENRLRVDPQKQQQQQQQQQQQRQPQPQQQQRQQQQQSPQPAQTPFDLFREELQSSNDTQQTQQQQYLQQSQHNHIEQQPPQPQPVSQNPFDALSSSFSEAIDEVDQIGHQEDANGPFDMASVEIPQPRNEQQSTPSHLDAFDPFIMTPPAASISTPASSSSSFLSSASTSVTSQQRSGSQGTTAAETFSTPGPFPAAPPTSGVSATSSITTFDPFSDDPPQSSGNGLPPVGSTADFPGHGHAATAASSQYTVDSQPYEWSDDDDDDDDDNAGNGDGGGDGSYPRRFSDPRLQAMYGDAAAAATPTSTSSWSSSSSSRRRKAGPQPLGKPPQGMLLVRSSARSLLVKDWRPCFVAFTAPPPPRSLPAPRAPEASPSAATSQLPQTGTTANAEKTTLLVFRSEADHEAYLNLGSSPYRDAERARLVKKSVDVSYFHKCTPIKVKRYEGYAAVSRRNSKVKMQQQQYQQGAYVAPHSGELPHFSFEELSDYGPIPVLKFATTDSGDSNGVRGTAMGQLGESQVGNGRLLEELRGYLNDIIRNGRYARCSSRPAVPSPFD